MRISSRFSHLFPLHSYIMFLMLLPFLVSCSIPFHCLFNFIQIFSITFNPILSHSITVYSIFQSHFFFCNYYFLTAYIIGISVNDFNFDLFIIYSFPFKICKDLESNGRMDFHDDPNMKTLWESQKKTIQCEKVDSSSYPQDVSWDITKMQIPLRQDFPKTEFSGWKVRRTQMCCPNMVELVLSSLMKCQFRYNRTQMGVCENSTKTN